MRNIRISDKTYELIKDQLNEEEEKSIEDLQDLVGQTYTFWCARYIYHGKVKAVNTTYITLENAGIVYDTGELDSKEPSDKQDLPKDCQILWSAVESFMKLRW